MTKNKQTVAFQGTYGAYSEEALKTYFENDHIESLPCESFLDIFKAIESKKANFGVLPVENSLAGTVIQAYDELLNHKLTIHAEIKLRVRHHLMCHKKSNETKIKKVYSHPQALSQCHDNLIKYNLKPCAYYDTAGAAKFISDEKDHSNAAIASQLAAETYDLKILNHSFEDEDFNFTRFFILSDQEKVFNPAKEYKTSVAFTLDHKPNSLVQALSVFSSRGINLCKIESRPSREGPWQYLFLADFLGYENTTLIKEALDQFKAQVKFLRILGSYEIF